MPCGPGHPGRRLPPTPTGPRSQRRLTWGLQHCPRPRMRRARGGPRRIAGAVAPFLPKPRAARPLLARGAPFPSPPGPGEEARRGDPLRSRSPLGPPWPGRETLAQAWGRGKGCAPRQGWPRLAGLREAGGDLPCYPPRRFGGVPPRDGGTWRGAPACATPSAARNLEVASGAASGAGGVGTSQRVLYLMEEKSLHGLWLCEGLCEVVQGCARGCAGVAQAFFLIPLLFP